MEQRTRLVLHHLTCNPSTGHISPFKSSGFFSRVNRMAMLPHCPKRNLCALSINALAFYHWSWSWRSISEETRCHCPSKTGRAHSIHSTPILILYCMWIGTVICDSLYKGYRAPLRWRSAPLGPAVSRDTIATPAQPLHMPPKV